MWKGVAAVVLSATLGCVHEPQQPQPNPYAVEAHYQRQMYVATLAWYNALQAAHLQLRMAQMSRDHQAEQFADKLDEVLVLNEDLEKRLAQAERALAEIESLQGNESAPLPAGAQRVLAELRQMRALKNERAKAYRELVRSVQHLIDTGRIRAVIDRQGQVRFVLPRELDSTDPWM